MKGKKYNSVYRGRQLDRIAFPMGGLGAGMFCLEGTGALSHFSLRHQPDMFNEPNTFSALCIKGKKNMARILEGPVPKWKIFGVPGDGKGNQGKTHGLPRFENVRFKANFPFATVSLTDPGFPVDVAITGWSPFIPGDADNSSLPAASLEFCFKNRCNKKIDAVYSFHSANFMSTGIGGGSVRATARGFIFDQPGNSEKPWGQGLFCAETDDPSTQVNGVWYKYAWYDPIAIAWKDVEEGKCYDRPPLPAGEPCPGASLFVPFTLGAKEERTIRLQLSWYVPQTNLRIGDPQPIPCNCSSESCCDQKDEAPSTYRPWYSNRFGSIEAVAAYWGENFNDLRTRTAKFTDCFYQSSLPGEVIEAIAANLSILKSPTILRQGDGRLWAWEGCGDTEGCCSGSCTHVLNYAQALPHLFPELERTFRQTEFDDSQDEKGHQTFRATLPIGSGEHKSHAAADGQLGGIMKMYRDWRICGNTGWLKKLWPKIKDSLDYCVETFDPNHEGIIQEPHHNTYDIEFWGPDGMCTSFYLGALKAAILMAEALEEDAVLYKKLLEKGRRYLEKDLYNGEYFFQKVKWKNLRSPNPIEAYLRLKKYPPEVLELLRKEGPVYQNGTGCLSDGIMGVWMGAVCGIDGFVDERKVIRHLRSAVRYNFKKDLGSHPNPKRPGYAMGHESGLLVCTWPKGGRPYLANPYADTVFTGIEYQVASHLIMAGEMEKGLAIVRACRDRYDGHVRNPFDEYECGHWYARAMASYALLLAMTGVRYDAVDKTLYVRPPVKTPRFKTFFAAAGGFGTVAVNGRTLTVKMKAGKMEMEKISFQFKGKKKEIAGDFTVSEGKEIKINL